MPGNILQSIGQVVGNQIGALSSIANMASLFIHLPEEYQAKIRPVSGGFPVVGSRPNFSPMIFTVNIFGTDEVPKSPKQGVAKVGLPGSAISTLGGNSAKDTIKAKYRPKRRSLIPPLVLLVNPSDFDVSAKKAVSETYAKRGWIVEHWGEELDSITVTGRTGGFYVGNFFFEEKTGLTRLNAINSAAYQNIMALYLIYKNNGYNHEKQFDRRRINSVGHVTMYYDYTTYRGSFRNFRLTEDAEKPFQFSYSFEFVPRETLKSMRPFRGAFF